jgi:hypothetical protein
LALPCKYGFETQGPTGDYLGEWRKFEIKFIANFNFGKLIFCDGKIFGQLAIATESKKSQLLPICIMAKTLWREIYPLDQGN